MVCFASPRFLAVLAVVVAGIAPVSSAQAQCSAHPWADVIVASSPAAGNAAAVLRAPDGVVIGFDNVGTDPGFVIVAFDGEVIVDGAGPDFAIHLTDFPTSEAFEVFEVRVSADGQTWASLGVVLPTTPFQNVAERRTFDIQPTGLASVSRIMVRNTTVNAANSNEGVDLDAFEALHCAAPANDELIACQDDLDACSTELTTCERELDDERAHLETCSTELEGCEREMNQAGIDLQACREDLDDRTAALSACDRALETAAGDLGEAGGGLREIERLLALPPGQRESAYRCSGTLCDGMRRIIDMLLAPPGQNVRRGQGR